MAIVIKNMSQLQNALQSKMLSIFEKIAEDVKNEVDNYIDSYYKEWQPNYYERTEQLKQCCKIGIPKIIDGKLTIEVYWDIPSLHYTTVGASAYKTIVSANAGLHGGWNIDTMEQIPWNAIKSNDGSSYGDGTQIWEAPIRELIQNGKLIELFKQNAKKYGLKIQ